MSDKLNTYSSASLAYLGDCAIELCVREYLVKEKGLSSSAKLNKEALKFVKASAQAEAMKTYSIFSPRRRPTSFTAEEIWGIQAHPNLQRWPNTEALRVWKRYSAGSTLPKSRSA